MPNIKLATKLASTDQEFAKALLTNPESFKEGFNLSEKQIASIKDMTKAGHPFDPGRIGPQASYEA